MSRHYAVLGTSAPVTTVKVGVRSIPVPFTGQLVHLVFSVGAPNSHGASRFDVKLNGISIFATPEERPSIASGQRSVVISGLEIEVAEDDVLSWDAVSVPLGGLAAPVTCTAVLDDLAPANVLVAESAGEPVTATTIRVADGDLEDLGGGELRIKTASDVVLPDAPSSLPPNGAASGDLAGEYPGPVVNQLKGRSLGGIPEVLGLFEDDFADGSINPVWGQLGTNLAVESGGVLTLGDTGGAAYVGLRSQAFNLAGRTTAVRVIAHGGGDTALVWTGGGIAVCFFILNTGQFKYFIFDGGTPTNVTTAGGEFASGIILRIRHDAGAGRFYWETSIDDGETWVERHSFVYAATLSAMTIDLRHFDANGIDTVFDDFQTDVTLTDPLAGKNNFGLVWSEADNHFSVQKVYGIIPAVPAGSPPSGAPSNLPDGCTAVLIEMTNPATLHVWNTATSGWQRRLINS